VCYVTVGLAGCKEMVFSAEDKILIKELREATGYMAQRDSSLLHFDKQTVQLSIQWITRSGVLQDRVYRTRIRDVAHLRERLIEEWSRFDQRIIDGTVNDQWRQRLSACVRAEGGHFEHQL
jgi:hypothetical protein